MPSLTEPLVSVICLCYNHEKYVKESIESVFNQSYTNIELIVVDDASKDQSRQVIEAALKDYENARFFVLEANLGNCKAFNTGWRMAKGKYVIDLAADDLLLPERIAVGVKELQFRGDEYGVHFTDANLIDGNGRPLESHITAEFFDGDVPQGLIFPDLLSKYFINPVTMMYSNRMLNALQGYDENLAYEDFDLWVRSSKLFKYCYTAQILVAKRQLRGSHGKKQYRHGNSLIHSTYLVCVKAFNLCESSTEYDSLLIRINYELKRAFFSLNWKVALKFSSLRKLTLGKIATLKS